MRRDADRVFFWVLASIFALSPLPWGGMPVWAASFWAVVVCVCLIAWGIRMAANPGLRVAADDTGPTLILFAIVLACILGQAAPWWPERWHHPLWADARAAGLDVAGSISINPFATGTAAMKLITAAGVFWLTLVTCRASEVKERLLYIIVVVEIAYALWGVISFLNPFGIDPDAPPALASFARRFSSTFVNPNTYAAFANFGALCCALMLLRIIDQGLITDRGGAVLRRSFLKALFEKGGPWLAGFVLLVSASLLSASRGGMISLAGGLLVLALTQGSTALRRRLAIPAAVALIAALGLGGFWLSGEKLDARLTHERLEVDIGERGRIGYWQVALEAIKGRLWLGAGFGTFDDASVINRPADLPPGRLERAHNDYLEFAADLGLPLSGLWLAVLCSVLIAVRRRWRSDARHAPYAALAFAATAGLALHSVVDFPLQLPANAYLYASLLALPLGRSAHSATRSTRRAVARP